MKPTTNSSTINIKITNHVSVTLPNTPEVVYYTDEDPSIALYVRRGSVHVTIGVDEQGHLVTAEVFRPSDTGCSKLGLQVVNEGHARHKLQAFIDEALNFERQVAEYNEKVQRLVDTYGVTPKEAREALEKGNRSLLNASVILLTEIAADLQVPVWVAMESLAADRRAKHITRGL